MANATDDLEVNERRGNENIMGFRLSATKS